MKNTINKNKTFVPVAPLMGFPGIQITQTTIQQNLENEDIQFSTLYALYDKFHPNFMFCMMDLSVEAEALGIKILKLKNHPYTVIDHPIKDMLDLGLLKIPNPLKDGRMNIFLKVIRKMKNNMHCPVVAYVIGPYTLTGLMSGAGWTLKNTIKNPELINKFLKFSFEVINIYCRALIDSGADYMCVLEPTTSGLSPKQYSEFSGKYIKKLKNKHHVPFILHVCGDTSALIKEMIKTDCDGISLDSQVNLPEISKDVPENILILGNVDPVRVITFGEVDEVEKVVKLLLEGMKNRDNFILSTGCDLPPNSKLPNIKCMFEIAKKYK